MLATPPTLDFTSLHANRYEKGTFVTLSMKPVTVLATSPTSQANFGPAVTELSGSCGAQAFLHCTLRFFKG